MTRKYITLNQPTISTISLTFSIFFFMYLCKKRQEENSKTQNFMKISTFFNNLPPFFSIIKKSYTDFQHYTSNILKDCWYRIALFLSKNLQIPLLCSYYGVKLESERYEMDLKRAGLVIIINQKNFHRDFEDRTGTDFDRDRLIQIWEMYGFHVVTYENLDYLDIQRKIRESINKDFNEEYCCLVVVILSHGENGVIFDVNGKPVEIEMIKLIMKKNEKLLGKPKILMIQACQGDGKEGIKHRMPRRNDQENLDDDHYLVSDGPSSEQAAMINADFCQVIATTPGYLAIRDKIKGSWLIQHFCDTMSEDGARDHFLDIILTTKNKISKETWNGTGMVPENKDTFQKYLYFIPVNVNEKKINGKEVIVSILKSFIN
ncbi:caspase-3-like [Chrysoperla carnea]|uniref:caspase-3-like n=1 Tax=Chrysoperla carnea TaxID=189513 RepID=UPI001D0710E4|nr:caspase-3-like [Chrysoperla carnea]